VCVHASKYPDCTIWFYFYLNALFFFFVLYLLCIVVCVSVQVCEWGYVCGMGSHFFVVVLWTFDMLRDGICVVFM